MSSIAKVAHPEVREKAIIRYGEESVKQSVELFQTMGLPGGLLPLEDVVEGGWVEETGFVWMITKREQKHRFKKAERDCWYKEEVSCYLEKNRMKEIKGVKAKEMLVWVPVNEIYIDEANPEKIHFKSVVGISRSFPKSYFETDEASK